METNLPPPPPTRKRSRLGTASFILGIIAFLLAVPYYVEWFVEIRNQSVIMVIAWVMELAGLTALVGFGLAIAALVRRGTRKLFAVIGLLLNFVVWLTSLPLAIYVGIIIVSNLFYR